MATNKPTVADLTKRVAELEGQLADAQGTNTTLIEANNELIKTNEQLILEVQLAAVPEGYVLLPIEPTEEIMLAGSDDQDSPWDAQTPGRLIRRRILAAITDVLSKRL